MPRLSQQSQITPGPSSSTQTPEIAPKDTSVAPEEPNKDKPVQEETNSSTPMNEPDNVEEAAQTAISTWREEISDGVVKPPQDNDGSSSVKNTPADPKGKGKAFDVETVSRSQSQQSAVSDHVKTKNGLEGQLNRHLGQLDRIRRVVGLLNNEIQGLDGQLAAKRRLHREDPVLLGHLQTEIEFLRGCRNTCKFDTFRLRCWASCPGLLSLPHVLVSADSADTFDYRCPHRRIPSRPNPTHCR